MSLWWRSGRYWSLFVEVPRRSVQAKNTALKEAGAIVPDSFEALEGAVKQTYDKLVADGVLVPQPDVPAPSVPLDLEAAKKAGKACPQSILISKKDDPAFLKICRRSTVPAKCSTKCFWQKG